MLDTDADAIIDKLVQEKLNGKSHSDLRLLLNQYSLEPGYTKQLLRISDDMFLNIQKIKARMSKAKEMCLYGLVTSFIGCIFIILIFGGVIQLNSYDWLIFIPEFLGLFVFWKNYKAYKNLKAQLTIYQ